MPPEAFAAKIPSALPPIDLRLATRESGDPVERASSRIVSVDNAGMGASGNTVDADGKSLEARTGASGWRDNVVTSNATLENSVPTPDVGLGGFDSRPTGNLPAIWPHGGYRVVFCGPVYVRVRTALRTEQLIRLEAVPISRG